MALFSHRIHCYFCNTRSPHSKSSGILQYQCASCEAWNYLDRNGDIVDTPASVAAEQRPGAYKQPAFDTFTLPVPESLRHQKKQTFCNTCLHNQRVVMEAMSGYLPDEDHPEYRKYEDALPEFKRGMEARYPQICRRCAPLAQTKINRADYYAGTENMSRLARRKVGRRGLANEGQRDDWFKQVMRIVLSLVGWIAFASLLVQSAWHVYGMVVARADSATAADGYETTDYALDVTPSACATRSLRMRFDNNCYQLFASYVQYALMTSALLLWYNPGLIAWYHGTIRIAAVTGQKEHFYVQVLLLIVRAVAYFNLSDPAATARLTTQQLLASHGFVVFFTFATSWLSYRVIKTELFQVSFKIMPRPEEKDVLGQFAGPETVQYQPEASSIPPTQLMARDRTTPFPIANLAPKRTLTRPAMPSPPLSDDTDVSDDGDAMDVDPQPTLQSQMPGAKIDRTFRPRGVPKRASPPQLRSVYNYGNTQGLGWSGVRDELFGIQDNLTLEAKRKRKEEEEKVKLSYQPPVQLNAFRGRLPQAPQSQERRLRNPVTQLSFKKVEPSKQKNFLQQMRDGIDAGKAFALPAKAEVQHARFAPQRGYDDDEDFSPAKTRTRGELQLRDSGWTLPTDVPQETGLESLFAGNGFRIRDEPALDGLIPSGQSSLGRDFLHYANRALFVTAVSAAVVAAACCVPTIRAPVAVWLLERIDGWGL